MTLNERARAIAREPLVHFLLGGALIFAWFLWQGEEADPASRVIEVTPEVQAQVALTFERTMQRPPTDAELDRLIERYVREEVLYREALRLGLDADDPVVRRRLAKKMDFLATSSAEAVIPSDAELEEWYAGNAARYSSDARISFDQVYFAAQPRDVDASRLSGNWRELSEPSSLPASLELRPVADIAAQFGAQFAEILQSSETDSAWTGPIQSGVGWHYVRVSAVEAGSVPPLADNREQVSQDWRTATAETRKDEAYRLLREAYTVEIGK